MTWYDKNFNYRQRVAVQTVGGGGSSATVDVEFIVPPDWDHFWEQIRSDMFDVVPTTNKGVALTFSRKGGASYANRSLTIQVDGLAILNDNSITMIYLYYGYASASDLSGSVTITSAKTGIISLQRPSGFLVPAIGRSAASDSLLTSFLKGASEHVDIFFLIGGMLVTRLDSYNEHLDQEDIDYVQVFSYDSSGTNDTSRIEVLATEFGGGFVRARFKGGSSGSNYAATIQIYTTENQILESRALLRVKDLLPES